MQIKKIAGIYFTALFVIITLYSHSANRYWVSGGSSNWNNTSNWSTSTGGSSGASVPSTGDIAIFDGNGTGSCTIDATVDIAGLDIQGGYSGTISQGAYTITVGTSNANFGGGTFTGGSADITFDGTFTLAGTAFTTTSGTITLNSTVSATGAGSFTVVTNNTIVLNSSGSQTILPTNYYNITSSNSGSRTFAPFGTIGIAGTFTKGGNTYTVSGSTVDFNGSGAQNIPAFTFDNLTCSGSSTKTATGAITVGALTISSGTTLDMGTNTLSGVSSISGTGTLKTQETSSTPIPTGKTWTCEVQYNNGSSSQTIVNGSYNNINASGNNRTLSTSTIYISGTFTTGSGTYTTTSSTIEFNGTSQTIPMFTSGDYNNLICGGSGTKTAAANLSVAGTLTINSGVNLDMVTNALSSVGTTSGTGTLKTQSTSSPIPSGETWNFTVEYNGGAVTIVDGTYEKLTCTGSNTKTVGADLTVNSTVTINSGCTLDMVTYELLVATTGAGSGTLQTQSTNALPIPENMTWASTATVEYNSASAQTIVVGDYGNLNIGNGDRTFSPGDGSEWISISGTLTLNSTGTPTHTITGSQINFNGSGSQTIPAFTYATLRSNSSGARTLASSGTISITDAFWAGTNSYTVTGSTIEMKTAQIREAFTFNNLTCSDAGTTTAQADIAVDGILTIGTSCMLTMTIYQLTGSISSTSGDGILRTAHTSTSTPIPAGETWTFMVDYIDNGPVTVVSGNYTDMRWFNGDRVLSSTGIIAVSGTLTRGSGSYTVTGSTVEFNGAAQNIPTGLYNNLTCSGSGDKTVTGSGDLTINGTLTINSGRILDMSTKVFAGSPTSSGTGTLKTQCTTSTSSTPIPAGVTWTFGSIEYNSASPQTIVNGNYIDLNGTNGNRTLATSGSIGIFGTFTVGGGTYTTTSSTVDFNGSGSQTIPALNYNNLTSSSSGARTLASSGTVGIAGTFTKGSNSYTVTSSTVDFNGSGAQNIPAFTFNSLTCSNGSTKTATGALVVDATLTVSSSTTLDMGSNALSGTLSSITGTGTIKTQNTTSTPIPVSKTWTQTVEYNHSSSQTVVVGTYENLTCSTGGTKSAANNITVNTTLTINSGVTFDMVTYILSGITTVSGTGTLKTQCTTATSATPIPTGKTWTCTVQYNSGSAQTIVYGNYTDLDGTGGNRTLSTTNSVGISGTFTKGSGTYTVTSSTVDYNGASQNLTNLTYNNLTCSGSGTKTAAGTGTFNVNGVLTIATGVTMDMNTGVLGGTLTSTSGDGNFKTQCPTSTSSTPVPAAKTWTFSTFQYNSSSAQTVVRGNYVNLDLLGGSRTFSTTGTIGVSGTFSVDQSTYSYVVSLSEVEYNGTGAQTITAFNYYHLSSSSTGTRTLPSSGTVGVKGSFSKGTNTYTTTGSTFDYNGTIAQTLTSFNYYNLTISGSRGSNDVNFPSASIGVANTFSPSATFSGGDYVINLGTVNYNGTGAQTVTAFNYHNLTLSGSRGSNNVTLASTGTIGVRGTFTASATFSGGSFVVTGSTIDYNYTNAQSVTAFNYNNLTISQARTNQDVTFPTGTIGIAGTFSPTATFTSGQYNMNTNNVVDYNGTGAQTITAFDYRNLTISGTRSGNVTLASSGTIGITRAFTNSTTFSSGNYVITGSTIEYRAGIAQTVIAFNYNNLILSSARTTNNITLASSGTIGIAGNFTNTATFTSGSIVVTGSTIDFNGSGSQSFPAFTFNNLTSSGSGTKTAGGAVTVNTALAISSGSTLDMDANTLSGVSSNSGTGTLKTKEGSSTPIPTGKTWAPTVEYHGTAAQTVVNGSYSNLTISGARTSNDVTLSTSTISISGTFTPSATFTSGGYIITSSTIDYNGTGAQSIAAFNYNNLTISGARSSNNVTLANSGTIGIIGTFSTTATSVNYINTGNTVDYNGTGAQTVIAFNYNNLTLSGARTSNNLTLASSGTIGVKGTYNNTFSFTSGSLVTTGSTIEFNGTTNQVITGSTDVYFQKLKVDKSSGKLYLSRPSFVKEQLILTKGIIASSATDYLQFNNGVDTVLGGSDSSYVSGPVKKLGDEVFNFPLGDTTVVSGPYHPLSITAPGSGTDLFTAQYFGSNQSYGDSLDTDSLISISTCEYWTLVRNVGTSTVIPSLGWNTSSCNVDDCHMARVSAWDGDRWNSLGYGGITGNGTLGMLEAAFGDTTSTLPLTIARPVNWAIYTLTVSGNDTACAGDSVNLEVSGSLTYSWSPSTGLSSTTGDSIMAAPPTTTTYTVTGTDVDGCEAMSTITVLIHPLPTINAGSNRTIVMGDSTTLGGSPTASGATSPYTYAWSPADSLDYDTIANPVTDPQISMSYELTVTDSFGCIKIDTVDVRVNMSLMVDAGTAKTICPSNTTRLGGVPTVIGGVPPYSYEWTPGTYMNHDTISNPVVNPPSTTTYTLTVTDAIGTIGSGSVTVTVLSGPSADAGAADTICPGGTVSLGGSPTASGGTSPYQYLWSPADSLDADTIANPTASPIITTTYIVTVIDTNNCWGTSEVTIVVKPDIAAFAGNDTTIFRGDTITIGGFPTASYGTAPYVYSWSPSGSLDSTGLSNPEATPDTTTSYIVTITDAGGCGNFYDTVRITIDTLPFVDAGPDVNLCLNDSVTIGGNPTTRGGVPPYSYTWSPSTALTSSSVANPKASPDTTTTYVISVTDDDGYTQTDTMVVYVKPIPSFNAGNDTTIYLSDIVLGADTTASGGTAPYAYEWSPTDDILVANIANPFARLSDTTTFMVVVTDSNSCYARDTVTVNFDNIFGSVCNLDSCTWTIDDIDSSNYTVGSGQKLCIRTTGVAFGNITLNDGGKICNSGILAPLSFHFNGGELNNNATGTITIDSTFISYSGGELLNDGVVEINGDLKTDSSSTIYNSGTIETQGKVIITASTLNNSGVISLNADNFIINDSAEINNYGTIRGIDSLENSATLSLGDSALIFTMNYFNYATGITQKIIADTSSSFGGIMVCSLTENYGNINDSVDICDKSPSAGPIYLDIDSGTVESSVIFCQISLVSIDSAEVCGSCATLAIENNGCTGDLITFTAVSTKTFDNYEFFYNHVSVQSGTDSIYTMIVPALEGDTVYVVGTSIHSPCKKIYSDTLYIQDKPEVSISGDSIATADSVILIASGATDYLWLDANGDTLSTDSILIAYPVVTTTYTVTGTDSNGCPGIATFEVLKLLQINYTVQSPPFYVPYSGAIGLSLTGGKFPFSYSWNTGNNASNLSSITKGTYHVTVTDASGQEAEADIVVGHSVEWAGTLGVSTSNNSITRTEAGTGWGEAGSVSSNMISSGQNGWAECPVNNNSDSCMFGLGTDDNNGEYDEIEYAIAVEGGDLKVYELGVFKSNLGSYEEGDIIRVEREGSDILYKKNGVELYSSATSPSVSLRVNTAIYKSWGQLGPVQANMDAYSAALHVAHYTCSEDFYKNFTHTTNYDEDGNIIAEGKVYYDYLGRQIQTQDRIISDNDIIVTQTLYDAYGRMVLQTLPAPINQSDICYKDKFITNASGANYSNSDFNTPNYSFFPNSFFPGEVDWPKAVGNTVPGNLGWYYSDNNYSESYVPASRYPYTRVEYNDVSGGDVKRVSAAGEQLYMGSKHEVQSYQLRTLNELDYFYGKEKCWIVEEYTDNDEDGQGTIDVADISSLQGRVFKTVTIDQNGQEAVSFTDMEGKILASCMSGQKDGVNVNEKQITKIILSRTYVDIHIPKGCENSLTIKNGYDLTNSFPVTYNILDLKTGLYMKVGNNVDFTGNIVTPNIPAGVYRIIYKNGGQPYSNGAYIYSFDITQNINYHDFTIYYYDKAGRLRLTVPPAGADYAFDPSTDPPVHKMISSSEYNSLGWLISAIAPDEGKTEYIYRTDGQLRFSKNSRQRASSATASEQKFSYVNYDNLGRVIETGEYDPLTSVPGGTPAAKYFDESFIASDLDAIRCSQETYTMYDVEDTNPASYDQTCLLGKVSKTWNDASSTWYSYDELGRINWTVQEINDMPTYGLIDNVKRIDYTYDLVGNVAEVIYQKDQTEEFHHYYEYDADKRLEKVFTSADAGDTKQEQAVYSYYKHGPLKRMELANKLQGEDYVYTINGWLKSINCPELNDRDPGKDGMAYGTSHSPKDLFGMTLDYFAGDYLRSSTYVQTYSGSETKNLYNGLIKAHRWQTNIPGWSGIEYSSGQLMYAYLYDTKYQLNSAIFGTITSAGTINRPSGIYTYPGYIGPIFDSEDDYKVWGITYDPNGNMKTLSRNKVGGDMDLLTFNYNEVSGRLINNKLRNVEDASSSSESVDVDFYDQSDYDDNYAYDATGQQTGDITDLNYTDYDVYGKVTAIWADAGKTALKASFTYDEKGFRIRKLNNSGVSTWYIHDASGNVISTYESGGGSVAHKEINLFGNKRLGIYNVVSGSYLYELMDHLGNVRATFSSSKQTSISTGFEGSDPDDYLFTYNTNIDNTTGANGSPSSAKLVANSSAGGTFSTGIFNIPVEAGQTIGGSFWYQTSGSSPNAMLVFVVTNPATGATSQWEPRWTGTSIGSFTQVYFSACTLSVSGLLSIYFWNNDGSQTVWFDDLILTFSGVDAGIAIAEQQTMTDYYPHGGIMPDRNYDPNYYRHGYQGQFAEKDDETRLNSFELRQYDAKLARWMSPDPMRQFASPYNAMWNNPVNFIDPSGGFATGPIQDFFRGIGNIFAGRKWGAKYGITNHGLNLETHWVLELHTESILSTAVMPNLLGTTFTMNKNIDLSSQRNVSDYQVRFNGVYSWANETLSMSRRGKNIWNSDLINRTSPTLPNLSGGYGIEFSHTFPPPDAPSVFTSGNSTTSVLVEVVPTLNVSFQVRKRVTASPAWFRGIEKRTDAGKEKNYRIDD